MGRMHLRYQVHTASSPLLSRWTFSRLQPLTRALNSIGRFCGRRRMSATNSFPILARSTASTFVTRRDTSSDPSAEPTAAGIVKVEFESQSVDLATNGIVNLDPNLLSVLLLNQHPSFVELVMRTHPMRVQPLGGASSIRQSRIPSIATTSGPPEAIPPPPVSSVTVPPAFVAAPPSLAEATIPPTIANSATPSRIYLGVEASKAQLVEAAGYFTHE